MNNGDFGTSESMDVRLKGTASKWNPPIEDARWTTQPGVL
jgi:hypothetical protein